MGVTFPTPEDLLRFTAGPERQWRLASPDDLPVADILRYGGMVGSHIHHYPSLHRCMDKARELIKQQSQQRQSLPSGTVLFAESLSGSKGRFSRVWHAPEGGLWCVLTVFNQWSRSVASLLPLASGVAVCETVRAFGLQADLKWVNDVCCHGQKVAGLLAETHVCPVSGEEYVLLGIGLNVNNGTFPPELTGIATSMSTQAGAVFDLYDVALHLLGKLTWNIGLLTWIDEHDQHLSLFMDQYRALCDSVGRLVHFGFDVQQSPQYDALVTGILDDGGLVMCPLPDDGRHRDAVNDCAELVEHGGEIAYQD